MYVKFSDWLSPWMAPAASLPLYSLFPKVFPVARDIHSPTILATLTLLCSPDPSSQTPILRHPETYHPMRHPRVCPRARPLQFSMCFSWGDECILSTQAQGQKPGVSFDSLPLYLYGVHLTQCLAPSQWLLCYYKDSSHHRVIQQNDLNSSVCPHLCPNPSSASTEKPCSSSAMSCNLANLFTVL